MVGKDEAIKISDELHDLLYLELPEADADPLKSLEDKLKIEAHVLKMKQAIDGFILELKMMGYKKPKRLLKMQRPSCLPTSRTGLKLEYQIQK